MAFLTIVQVMLSLCAIVFFFNEKNGDGVLRDKYRVSAALIISATRLTQNTLSTRRID